MSAERLERSKRNCLIQGGCARLTFANAGLVTDSNDPGMKF
jgi:hypothetical protein